MELATRCFSPPTDHFSLPCEEFLKALVPGRFPE